MKEHRKRGINEWRDYKTTRKWQKGVGNSNISIVTLNNIWINLSIERHQTRWNKTVMYVAIKDSLHLWGTRKLKMKGLTKISRVAFLCTK